MQLHYKQLSKHLSNKSLACIYFVSGEELLLVQTACSAIRSHAKKQGFSERAVFYAESSFNWQALLTHSNHYGLFSEKQMIELHLLQDVSEAGAQILKTYASNPPANKCLLIIAEKFDRRSQQTDWFKSIDAVGIYIAVWPIEKAQLALWITERLATMGLTAEKGAIQCLIFATEGNLLATAQEIDKLNLYFALDTPPVITQAAMLQALSDNARFSPFKLTDAALQGDASRCLRILNRFHEEGVEPLLILWSLSRECRQLAIFAFQLAQSKDLRMLFRIYHIGEKRQAVFQQALQRHSLAQWYKLLQCAAHADRVIKGATPGNIWNTLQRLSMQLAGLKTL
jgi:DNA polymerase-3 subunit delta